MSFDHDELWKLFMICYAKHCLDDKQCTLDYCLVSKQVHSKSNAAYHKKIIKISCCCFFFSSLSSPSLQVNKNLKSTKSFSAQSVCIACKLLSQGDTPHSGVGWPKIEPHRKEFEFPCSLAGPALPRRRSRIKRGETSRISTALLSERPRGHTRSFLLLYIAGRVCSLSLSQTICTARRGKDGSERTCIS